MGLAFVFGNRILSFYSWLIVVQLLAVYRLEWATAHHRTL
jgi:hypothetical protein